MEAESSAELIGVEDYLEGEKVAAMRNEFVAGQVFAMAGASEEHNIIAGNVFVALHAHLRGKVCRVFTFDMKVRLEVSAADLFYYPDVMVACEPSDTNRYFKRLPKVLVEVLSPETERTDRREKFVGYTQIPSLQEYVLIAQDKLAVTLFSRSTDWQAELLTKGDQQLRLASLDFSLSLRAIYEGVQT